MRIHCELLQMLISYWDLDQMAFIVDGEIVSFEFEDIYFMKGFSHRGAVVNLQGSGHIEGVLTI